jgi:lipoprotein NlpI
VPHTGMANILLGQHQYEKALAECDAANAQRPNAGSLMKAVIYLAMDDTAKAMEQANVAIAANENNGAAYRVRGNIEFAQQKWSDAANDYKKASALQPEGAYPAIWDFLAVARGGGDAKLELQSSLAALTSQDWPMPVGLMYIGKETPQQLLAAAESTSTYRARELKCEANFYIGELELLAGHKEEARDHFRRAMETSVESFIEYREAKAELKNLN